MNYPENLSVATSIEPSTSITQKMKIRRRVFTGNEDHVISLERASQLTKRYRDSVSHDAMKGGYFGRMIFETILAQEGCVGIRCYFASMEDGNPTLVMVGVEKNGNDLSDGVLGEDIWLCPPFCSAFNDLNSTGEERDVTEKRRMMVFTGHENHLVTIAEAARLIQNYRTGKPKDAIKGAYLGRSIFKKILGQEECVGIRFYFALNEDNTRTVVLVGVLPNGNDIVDGVLGDDVWLCPPFCAEVNPLNR